MAARLRLEQQREVESPAMLIRSIGSICTATVSGIGRARTSDRDRAYTPRPYGGEAGRGATKTASPRRVALPPPRDCARARSRRAREMRRRLASRDRDPAASSISSRALTSTKAIVAPRCDDEIDLAALDGEIGARGCDSPSRAANAAAIHSARRPNRCARRRGLRAPRHRRSPASKLQRPRVDFAARQAGVARRPRPPRP